MKTIAFLVVQSVFFFVGSAMSQERPTFPEPVEDEKLFVGKSPAEFFEARKSNAACWSKLQAAESAYQKSEAALKTLSDGEKDRRGPELEKQRAALLKLVETCGPCASRPIQSLEIEGPARTEYWLQGDGSCYLGGIPGINIEQSYSRMRESLLRPDAYARHNDGFRAILEFLPLEYESGKTLGLEPFTASPSYAYLVAVGIEFLNFVTGYDQVYKIEWRDVNDGLEIRYTGVPIPHDFSKPQVFLYSRSKKSKISVQSPQPVSRSLSSWFVRRDLLVRYFHATDFGEAAKFAEDRARWLLQDTAYTMAEIGQGWRFTSKIQKDQ